MKKILIIIPAYNEEANILNTFTSIVEFNKKYGTKYDVIVINDGSNDKTKQICIDNNIPMISLINNLGIGGAMQTGYKYACENNYDIALQYDGDGQHDVAYVEKIIKPIIEGEADFVIGSRFIYKEISEFQSSYVRRIGINVISFFTKLITGEKIYDVTSGFRAANRNVVTFFANNYPTEYPEPITNAELLKMHYKIKEVPVAMKERQGGISSINSWKSVYYMLNVVLAVLVIGIRRYTHVR